MTDITPLMYLEYLRSNTGQVSKLWAQEPTPQLAPPPRPAAHVPVRTTKQLSGSIIARLIREVEECNKYFHTLRTVIKPDEDRIDLFHFVMVPNDGAMAEQPLVGSMIIPSQYPLNPPVLHLYTRTERYNVDVFHGTTSEYSSSMCFDILNAYSGVWQSDFTISCLFASLMMSVVSINVPQQHGKDKLEVVDMRKLARIKNHVWTAYRKYRSIVPSIPVQKRCFGKAIPCKPLFFGDAIPYNNKSKRALMYTESIRVSRSFYLTEPVTFAIDVRSLAQYPDHVLSIVLTTNKYDLVGYRPETILLRNGVTATAAKKRENREIQWFYHGTPLNSGKDKLQVTIAKNQFVMCLINDEYQRPVVHGDGPISYLTPFEMGDTNGKKFHVVLYSKKPVGDTRTPDLPFLSTRGTGYIFDPEDRSDTLKINRVLNFSDLDIITQQ